MKSAHEMGWTNEATMAYLAGLGLGTMIRVAEHIEEGHPDVALAVARRAAEYHLGLLGVRGPDAEAIIRGASGPDALRGCD